eukprot:gene5443-7385_t
MGPPLPRERGGLGLVHDTASASRTFSTGSAVATPSHYGPTVGSALKPDPPGLASPVGGDTVKLVPESMKKNDEEHLKIFREMRFMRLHDVGYRATILRIRPSKYTTEMAENWKTMDVGVCLDDLINAKSIPNVLDLPMATALGGMGFADKLLDP